MHADEIIFMDAGCIVERGTHDELMDLRGRYQALYQLQTNPSNSLDQITEGIAKDTLGAGTVGIGS